MKRLSILVIILLMAVMGMQAAKVSKSVSIKVGKDTRSYYLYVPNSYTEKAPVVIAMHGTGGHSTDKQPNFNAVADKEGFIVAYPQGKNVYFPFFNASLPGWNSTGEYSEDIDFLKAIIEELAKNYDIDRQRLYCCGFSNGGMMTYTVANLCSDIFAAFASISGFPLNEFHLHHTGYRPVPFLHIHGKNDQLVKYSLLSTITDNMVMRNGANPVPVKTTVSGKYTKSVYEAMEGGFPYVVYEIPGMDHSPSTKNTEDGSEAQTMWNFMKQYTLDAPCDVTLKWRPRLEAEGYTPKSHGFTMNSGNTILAYGIGVSSDANQNVYRSLQLANGIYKLRFHSAGEEGKTFNVKLQLIKPQTVVLDKTVSVGGDATLFFTVNDPWGEYRLIFTREDTADDITITNLGIYSATDDEVNAIQSVTTQPAGDNTVYDLSGRRLGTLPVAKPGIYISNGKKVLVP